MLDGPETSEAEAVRCVVFRSLVLGSFQPARA
jgi:hypothetical protein